MMTVYPFPDPSAGPGVGPGGRPAAAGAPGTDFDGFAGLFDRFTAVWDWIDPSFARWLAAQLPARPGHGGTALDLGCGAGRHSVLLAAHYTQVLAVDLSGPILAIAEATRSRPGITYRQADVLDIDPARHGRFDAVVSVNTLHHAGPADIVLPRVRSLAAPGGVVVVVDIVDPGGWTDPGFHLDRAFTDARAAYHATGRTDVATDILNLLLHPQWLRMAATDTPLTRDQFHHAYGQVFPGADIVDDLHPLMAAAVWRNTDPEPVPAGGYGPGGGYGSGAGRG